MSLAFLWSFVHMNAIFLLLCLALHFTHTATVVHHGNETDQLALLEFRAKVTDPFGALSSWNGSNHFCQWFGVTCGHRHQRVTGLNLTSQILMGSISPHIGNMSFLKELVLLNNSLTHKIPPELGHLRRLRALWLNNNSISGEIPANISGCSNLVCLYFSNNNLVGKIPVELDSLSKLERIYVDGNSLTGDIPSSFGNLSSLQHFVITENSITGNIPGALGRLANLKYLGLGGNRLFGTLPSSIYNLSSISYFELTQNKIQGSLPWDLGITLPNLRYLGFGYNLFTGPLPFSISNASELHSLDIPFNEFTGKVSPLEKLQNLTRLSLSSNKLGAGEADDLSFLSSLTNASKLHVLALDENNFGGVLPESISNFSTQLAVLALENNKISGNIPTGIGNLANLETLSLWENQFTGNIPPDIAKLQNLKLLMLSFNKFSGNIPWSLGNLTLLNELALRENKFRGSIPSSLGKCQDLRALKLAQNNLSGTIPREVISLSALVHLNLSQNRLIGSLPMEVGNLKNIVELDVSGNMLSGEIPTTLGSCVMLGILYMAGNDFQGILPSSLRSLRGLEVLDLSHNNLSGQIPDYLGGFVFLQKLNLSLNNFDGTLPIRGIFKNATAVSVEGNKQLCGGIPELQLPSCNSQASKKKRSSDLTLKLKISVAFGILGLVFVFCFLFFSWFLRTRKVLSSRFLGNRFSKVFCMKVSYQSLLKATDGFSLNNLIGVGSFGSVYKGILEQGGTIVAVKVLNLQFRGASKSFIDECEALRNIRHRNLIKVITACSGVDYEGNDFKALVYEFMVNGSLQEWLYSNDNEGEECVASRNLSLLQRVNIAMDVASALDYLHHHCPKPIVHCDLKPNNVLLDDEMIGHVGDFGLAKFLPEATYNSSTNQSSSICVRGSIGYTAPEYGMGNKVSTFGDVYSYGILLLEMFTGKRPTANIFSDGLNLHNFAKMALPEQVMRIADPILLQRREEGEASSSINDTRNHIRASGNKIQECLVAIFRVGIACSEELPRDRMDIKDALNQLHVIRNNLLGTGRARLVIRP